MRISDWSSDVCSSDLQHAGRYIPSPRRTVPRQIPPRPARAEPEGPGQSSDAGRRDRIPQAETGGGGVAGPYGSAAPGHHRRTGPDDRARSVLSMQAILVAEGLCFPEGPVVLPDRSLLVLGIPHGQVTRIAPARTQPVVARAGGGTTGESG